ncbi:potassium-transporting ATPase, C subunit [Solidesulfovibrio carbinoliphilus subsp. oakridgensis]|uniref:Potassium-transporting ATPase KdpC subunit n=1 Tax=Solidesulfovibrio carbinoliphilus subsp. oakridgensis TaxID=694327 RepID=G7Q7G9_9BACT|nr:potassium-transporting ATPase subunit KdpC [Solidesulfovibrio carbinoliphilus]EHJ47122.1 potassium-transporting ATPase, C subunit [Solidesulfovibrio carbinoliphilus subsp. oakridgensis]
MFTKIYEQLKPSCLMFLWLSVLTGLGYPLVVTVLGTGLYPAQARGSLLRQDGVVLGSACIGQPFSSDRYFWGRPSATAPFPGNAASSSGSNLAPSNPALREAVRDRAAALGKDNPGGEVPMDLVTTSASGLDPHISPQAAAWQVDRVAKARGLSRQVVADLVARHAEGRLWGFWGEPRINVLGLNLALDGLAGSK